MRKRILFFGHTAQLGGGEIALLNLVRALDRKAYDLVVALAADGPLREKLCAARIETHVLPLDPAVVETRKDTLEGSSVLRLGAAWHALSYVLRLAGFIRRNGIDLVHTNSLKADVLGGLSARLARVPVLWHVRDRIEKDYLPARAVRVFRWLCRRVPHFVVANSQATLDTLQLNGSDKEVVHDGFPGLMRVTAPDAGGPLIGLVGRISRWKGQHIFLEAASLVRAKYPEARFQIIGSAMFGEETYEREIRALVHERGLEGCVEFTGFREDVQSLMGKLTVLVHASTTGEPFGQVVIEGMAAGKPVVATRGGGIPEIVLDGETGLLVKMGDAGEMAAALVRLLSNPARAAAMGEAGRRRVAEHFTIQHTARKVEAIYGKICRQGKPRDVLNEAEPTSWPATRDRAASREFQSVQQSTIEGQS